MIYYRHFVRFLSLIKLVYNANVRGRYQVMVQDCQNCDEEVYPYELVSSIVTKLVYISGALLGDPRLLGCLMINLRHKN